MTSLLDVPRPASDHRVVSSSRLVTLDSLRGIAALTVMIHHYLLTLPAVYPYGQPQASAFVKLLEFSPLHLLWAGYEAVLLFFVLSGFVLSLPPVHGATFHYVPFIIKRWTRIWLPYITVVTVAGLANLLVGHVHVDGTSVWFQDAWSGMSWIGYLQHLLLIGDLEPYQTEFVPVVWSLQYEMLASLLFPVLLFLSRSVPWPLLMVGSAVLNVIGHRYEQPLRGLEFPLMFLVGILLARHKDRLVSIVQGLPGVFRYLLLAVALGLYVCSWLGWRSGRSPLETALLDSGITLASALAIVIALSSRRASTLLTWRPVEWAGRISYSIYLTHTLVLLVVVHSLGRLLPLGILLALCVPLTLIVSHFTYRWVEQPSIWLGRRWSRRENTGAPPH